MPPGPDADELARNIRVAGARRMRERQDETGSGGKEQAAMHADPHLTIVW